jgi:hypothetical protein
MQSGIADLEDVRVRTFAADLQERRQAEGSPRILPSRSTASRLGRSEVWMFLPPPCRGSEAVPSPATREKVQKADEGLLILFGQLFN